MVGKTIKVAMINQGNGLLDQLNLENGSFLWNSDNFDANDLILILRLS